tara:strand:+ start:3841 stop:4896 length:1056 start_codon:yes stop_codon:yes gene_type:complete
MWLQLGIVLVVSLSAASALAQESGDGHADSRILVYDDDDATTVVTSIASAETILPKEVTVGAYAVLDAVSSASVDVVSAATGRWTENRVEVGATVAVPIAGTTLSMGANRSQENDWLSHTVSTGVSREFFERNTIVTAAYAFTRNKVGRAMDPNFEESLRAHSAEISVGQLLDRQTRAGVAYTFQALNGFQSSPYRYVAATDGASTPEIHPETRKRHALSAFALRSLTPWLSSRLAYRLYRDDWGIWSHTGSVRLAMEASKHIRLALDARMYNQSRAEFYRGSYSTSFTYMSRDRELASFWDAGGSGEITAELGPVTLDARLGAIRYRFRNFPSLPKRIAILAGAGAKVTW